MNGKAHTIRRTLQALVLTATVAAITGPVASAGNGGGAGLTPDTRDAVARGDVAQPAWLRALQIRGEGMNKLYGNVQPGWLRALQIRGEGMNKLYADGNTTPVGNVTSSDGGIDFGNVEIGIVGAVCGLLLLTALGIGARQARHTRHRLGSA